MKPTLFLFFALISCSVQAAEADPRQEWVRKLLDQSAREAARQLAVEWTQEAPNDVAAWVALADVLERDDIGRLRKPGYDRKGATEALRRAFAIDPSRRETLRKLAGLLALAPETSEEAFQDLLQLRVPPSPAEDAELFLLAIAARRPKELLRLSGLDPAVRLASESLTIGPELALKRHLRRVRKEEAQALTEKAAELCLSARLYPEAAKLFVASAEPEQRATRQTLATIRRHERIQIDAQEPGGVPLRLIALALETSDAPDPATVFSADVSESVRQEILQDLRSRLWQPSIPSGDVAFDLLLAGRNVSSIGSGGDAFHVRLLAPVPLSFQVVRESGGYRIKAFELDTARHQKVAALEKAAAEAIENHEPGPGRQLLLECIDLHGAPTADDWYLLGRVHEGDGLPTEALDAYLRAGPHPKAVARMRALEAQLHPDVSLAPDSGTPQDAPPRRDP